MSLPRENREQFDSAWRLVKRNAWKFTKIFTIFLLLGIGSCLLLLGTYQHNEVTSEATSPTREIVISADNDTVIQNMIVILDKNSINNNKEGWMETIIDFNTSCQKMSLGISLPHRIDHCQFKNYSRTSFFYTDSSYNESSDTAFLYVSFISSEEVSCIRVFFDWKVCEKISYDQERVPIVFSNPYYGKPLFQEILPVYGSLWIPKIDQLTIQIQAYNPIDISSTSPIPSYYYASDGRLSVYWTFDSRREVSSVQATFKDSALSRGKLDLVFQSGLYVAFGISTMLWGLKEVTEVLGLGMKAHEDKAKETQQDDASKRVTRTSRRRVENEKDRKSTSRTLIDWELRKQLTWVAVFLATVLGLMSLLGSGLLRGWADYSNSLSNSVTRAPFTVIYFLLLSFVDLSFYRLTSSLVRLRNWIERESDDLERQELIEKSDLKWFYGLFVRKIDENQFVLRKWLVGLFLILGDLLLFWALVSVR